MPTLLAVLLATAAVAADVSPERWEKTIAAFEEQDRQHPPAAAGIVCVGSSSIRLWDSKSAFGDLPVTNRGFGGSHMGDSAHFAERIVIPYKPSVVVVYAGGNDIAAGKSPVQVATDFQTLAGKIHKALPQTKVLFVSLFPSVARWRMDDDMRQANSLIETYTKTEPWLGFVDVRTKMTGTDGGPRPELLRADNLHLNDQGYEMWNEVVVPVVRAEYEQQQLAK